MDYTSKEAHHAVYLARTLYGYSKKQKHTDFKIHVGGTTTHCHKPVVCAQSSFIDGLCASVTSKEAGQALHETVRYMYLGTMELTKDILEVVLKTADIINHEDIRKTCEDFVISSLDIENCRKYIVTAEKFHLSSLSRACEGLQKQKFSDLIHTTWFPSLSARDLEMYLRDDHFSITNEDQALTQSNVQGCVTCSGLNSSQSPALPGILVFHTSLLIALCQALVPRQLLEVNIEHD